MTSRERVRQTLNGGKPDRIPNGITGCETAGMHVLAYDDARELLGLPRQPARVDTFMFNAVGERDFLKAAQCDIILLASPRMCAAELWSQGYESGWHSQKVWDRQVMLPITHQIKPRNGGWVWQTGNGEVICPENSYYFDGVGGKPQRITPDMYNPSHELPDDTLRRLEETARELYNSTDLSINCGETITDMQFATGSAEDWWIMLIEEQETVKEFLNKSLEASISQLKQLHQAIGKYCDMLSVAHDFGDTRGVTIGPQLWREIYKPIYKRWFGEWKKITDMKINLHSCGAIADILPDLIECGVDVINPVQISANGMQPERLRSISGDVVFYGGAYDAVQTPPSTPEHEVYTAVKRNITALSNGGGYIFAGVHNIPAGTPKAHLRAIWQAFLDVRDLT